MSIKDKYSLTREQNVFLAKKMLIDSIYNTAKLEGCNLTFPQTQTIINGVSVGGIQMHDVEVVLNLRDAWKHVLGTIENELILDYICKVNSYVARNESLEWGVLRTGKVGISGTDYIPEIPKKEEVEKNIKEILNGRESITEKAIKLFLWSCRSQLFWDGNKRTSLIVANKLLISEGKGIIVIKEEHLEEFNKRLVEFYNTNEYEEIIKVLYDKCIYGIEIS